MTFRVGQKVVCVGGFDAADLALVSQYGAASPIKNSIYTIEAIRDCLVGGEDKFFELCEIPPPTGSDFISFHQSHFRPIVLRKTDISALEALLVPRAKTRERA